MFKFKLWRKKNKDDISKIAEQELRENQDVIESLRDYDEGKKEISTDTVRERLSRVRTPS